MIHIAGKRAGVLIKPFFPKRISPNLPPAGDSDFKINFVFKGLFIIQL